MTSEPNVKSLSPDDHLWKEVDKSDLKAGIKITHNLVENPIFKEEISSIEELSDLKVGNQGTNFLSNQEEFEIILQMAENKTNRKYWLFAQVKKQESGMSFMTLVLWASVGMILVTLTN